MTEEEIDKFAQSLADIHNRIPDREAFIEKSIYVVFGAFFGTAITINLPKIMVLSGVVLLIVPMIALGIIYLYFIFRTVANRFSYFLHRRKLRRLHRD